MESESRFQFLEEAVCISHRGNGLGKSMKPSTLPPPVMDKLGRLGSLSHQGESKIQNSNQLIKTDLVLHPACSKRDVLSL